MAQWDWQELPGCVENLRAWQDENDGTMDWETNRDLTVILDWFRDKRIA